MTMFSTLQSHLARHKYTKGAHEGDAPADPSRRWRSHHRVVRVSDTAMAVRLHHTNILTAYADGDVVLYCAGWADSPTTRMAVWDSSRAFWRRINIHTYRGPGREPNTAVAVAGKTYIYYDGMRFSDAGVLLTHRKPATGRRALREARAELRKKFYASDVYRALPVWWDAATPSVGGSLWGITPTNIMDPRWVVDKIPVLKRIYGDNHAAAAVATCLLRTACAALTETFEFELPD